MFESPVESHALPVGWMGEIIEEELVASPRPSPRQARATFMLGVELGEWLEQRHGGDGRWSFLRAPEIRLGPDLLVPDLAGWRRERLAEDADVAVQLVPDWVCEVLSPTTTALDRARKLPSYARAGVSHVWLVDPVAHTLEVYQRIKRGWLLVACHEGDATVRAEPFPSMALELDNLWLPGEERSGH